MLVMWIVIGIKSGERPDALYNSCDQCFTECRNAARHHSAATDQRCTKLIVELANAICLEFSRRGLSCVATLANVARRTHRVGIPAVNNASAVTGRWNGSSFG